MSDLRKVFTILGASNHVEAEREKDDYYATSPEAIDVLLKNFELPKETKIWECACGEGHLSKRLLELGYDVISSDIVNRNFGKVKDFFACKEKLDENVTILTSPPYKYALEFVLHSLNLLPENAHCIMFLKLQFLEGQKRYNELFRSQPPKKVLVFSKRIKCVKNGDFKHTEDANSAMAFCWYIWQKSYTGAPVIEWV
jgi:hypothetical protein